MQSNSRVVASFPDYAGAQYAVDALADRKFPVDGLAIVGANLQSYEQITGRRGYGRAALEGFLSGAVIGAIIGWLFGLFSFIDPLVSAFLLALWGILIGGVLGLVLGLIAHALSGGRRDFSSVATVRAERYDVLAAAEIADEAERAIAELKAAPAPH
ncbi:general stress protein [Pseudonocardia nigra]|uniref:general stress protein n=1 Tax=Pseudonocardia nigra TaxID=1921578 RepID=UPI001C6018E7|nr:general stress protein [Pseudonocardia nigra]